MLGVQERFSPEKLATTASGALTALFLEIIVSIFYIISYYYMSPKEQGERVIEFYIIPVL